MTTIRKRLEQLSHDMAELGADMERAEWWCDDLNAHGQELQNAAVLARTWADGIREQLCDAVDEDAPKDVPCRSFVGNMCVQGLFEGLCNYKKSQKHCYAYNPAH